MNVYVTPPAVPGAPGTGTGTEQDPFHSVADGIKAAQNGGIVHLHAGHYVESVSWRQSRGDGHARIVVQPFGDGAVFIDSLLPEFLNPEPTTMGPGPHPNGTFNGEYVWHKPYPAPGIDDARRLRVNGGAFLDGPSTPAWSATASSGTCAPTTSCWPETSPAPPTATGSGARTTAEAGTYIPENRAGRIHRRPSVYMGPGIWFDQEPGEPPGPHPVWRPTEQHPGLAGLRAGRDRPEPAPAGTVPGKRTTRSS